MRTKMFFAILGSLPLFLTPSLRAQQVPDLTGTPPSAQIDLNINMRLRLDRTTVIACEPIYLTLTADRFATPLEQNIQITRKEDPLLDLGPMEKEWVRSDFSKSPMRLCVMLSQATVDGHARFLFSQPGEYRVRVKIGRDVTPVKLTVTAGPPSDEPAYAELGAENLNAILSENFPTEPSPDLLKVCRSVSQKYPESTATTYCRAYLAIAEFKDARRLHRRQGGKETWGPVVEQLERVFPAHQDDFFGEEVGYYLAYAQGLSGDFMAVIKTFDRVKTRMTPWGDQLNAMKEEVFQHVRPKDVVLPAAPTQPAH